MSNHRYSKFWWQDWHGDKALHACSVGARGFWMELLCIAHEGKPYGHVIINGEGATLKQMAASANCTEKDAKRWLAELEESRVFSRTDDGIIYNRRMKREPDEIEKFRVWGKKGGNPTLKGSDKPNDKPPRNGRDNPWPTPPPTGGPSSNIHRSESESESAREAARPSGGPASRSEAEEPRNSRGNPETEAVIVHLEAQGGRPVPSRPKAYHLTPEQLVIARGQRRGQG